MNRLRKGLRVIMCIMIFSLGIYILGKGFIVMKDSHLLERIWMPFRIEEMLEKVSVQTHLPTLLFSTVKNRQWMEYVIEDMFPVYTYTFNEIEKMPDLESRLEYELLVKIDRESQVKEEENEIQTERQTEEQIEKETSQQTEYPMSTETEGRIEEEKLKDYNELLRQFYVVDPSTVPLESQINYEMLMNKNMQLQENGDGPKILIYHTHSQEGFVDSVPEDLNTTIVGVGSRLAEILQNQYGYSVIHHTMVYDVIDGQLDRNKAYTLAAPDIEKILKENPSIEVVIDLHRDGVDGKRFVKDIHGKPTAQIMFFNGLSRTIRNGEIDYLPNPYIEDNLAFSFQLCRKAEQQYPGWTRCIYLQSLRYNLHLRPKALLIESGTQLNTLEEELNAMEPLADILNQVLRGE